MENSENLLLFKEPSLEFTLPPLLNTLIANGKWPADSSAVLAQNLRPLFTTQQVRRFAAEEDLISLKAPPFHTIADHLAVASVVALEQFWKKFCALEQIVPTKALILGDFGLGSDALIILDYRDSQDPPVLRLRYSPGGLTDWVPSARNFNEFACILGLVD